MGKRYFLRHFSFTYLDHVAFLFYFYVLLRQQGKILGPEGETFYQEHAKVSVKIYLL